MDDNQIAKRLAEKAEMEATLQQRPELRPVEEQDDVPVDSAKDDSLNLAGAPEMPDEPPVPSADAEEDDEHIPDAIDGRAKPIDADGRELLERTRIDRIITVPSDLGSGAPRRDERTDLEIAEQVRDSIELKESCRTHGTPGCTICRDRATSLKRHKDLKFIRDWLLSDGPVDVVVCTSNVDAIYEALEDTKLLITGDMCLASLVLADVERRPKTKVRIIRPESPKRIQPLEPVNIPLSTAKPSRPKQVRHKLKTFPSWRKAYRLTCRQVAKLMEDPRFENEATLMGYDTMLNNKPLLNCYADFCATGFGMYGKHKLTTIQEIESYMPFSVTSHFEEDDLHLYRDYAYCNRPAGEFSAPVILVIENAIMHHLETVRLIRRAENVVHVVRDSPDRRRIKILKPHELPGDFQFEKIDDLDSGLDADHDLEIQGIIIGAVKVDSIIGGLDRHQDFNRGALHWGDKDVSSEDNGGADYDVSDDSVASE